MAISKEEELLDWQGSKCWFCDRRPPVHGMSKVVIMRKVQYGADGGMKWLCSSVAVPCCAACRAGQERARRILLYSVFGPALAMSLIMALWGPDDFWVKAFLVFVAGGAGGLFGGSARLPAGQKPESEAASFKAVQTMLEGGWAIMDTPPPAP